jgi:hypothetical protein
MDEILIPGWRSELDKAYADGVSRPRYQYTWNWKDDAETVPGLQYGGDKIHTRFGYRWKHAVQEVLVSYGETAETQGWYGLEIHHHADNSKPRSQYLPLLKIAVQEDLHDDRNAFYYARELYFYGKYAEASAEFRRHLNLPSATWAPERAASMRYLAKIEPNNRHDWLLKAIDQAPGRREALVELAQHLYEQQDWAECFRTALKALEIKEKPLDYLCEEFAWGALPYDLAAISAHNLGLNKESVSYGEQAELLAPNDERLKTNNYYYRQALLSSAS